MTDEKTTTTITSSDPDTLLEVALGADDEGLPTLELRRLSWGEGVGWYRQQTLRLHASEAEGLLSALRGNRSHWRERSSASPARKVIPFPHPAAQQEASVRKTA